MKIILLTLVIALLSNSSYCQKKGCGEIQLGATLSSVKALNHYKLTSDTTQKNVWLICRDSLRMFLMDIDFFEVTVSDKGVIKRIRLFSKQKIFADYHDWLFNLKYVLNVVNSEVGKLNSDDLSRPYSKELSFAWSFVDTKTALVLIQPMVDTSATNFRGNYIFTWIEDKQNLADKKF